MHPDRDQITRAAERIGTVVRQTPTFDVDGSEFSCAGSISLKLEHHQHSGSFKARGASNAILANVVPAAGLVAASGGNHGAAVAWAAASLGHSAAIFVPSIAAPAKIARLRQYGADVHIVGQVFADALTASQEYLASTGAMSVHAYDEPLVVAGAGTVGREFEAQVGPLNHVLVACGGGGLSGGLAAWFGQSTNVVVVETEGTATFRAAHDAGHPVPIDVSGIAADSLGATQLGQVGWSALSHGRSQSLVIGDDDVIAGQRHLWDRFRIMAEPAAAAPAAALLTGAFRPDGSERVGVVICGANSGSPQ